MKNKLLKLTALSLIASSAIYAAGYKIPETSLNAIALSAANVAHSNSADAAYYNPANMSFMKDENNLEMDLIVIGLEPTKFDGKGSVGGQWIDANNISAESEIFYIPSTHFVSNKFGDFRYGLNIVVPGGLTKRWEVSPAKDKAEEFTLTVVELNPSVSYLVNDNLSIALGARVVHSEGIVKSASSASRDMEGDSLDFGYNLALAYKPTSALELAITYRSKVDLTQEGNAKLSIGNAKVYDGGSSVSVPLPALLNVAVAYTFKSKTTLEFVYEKNFWSAYKTLDFNYSSTIPAILHATMDKPKTKNWNDTNVYRLGITQELDEFTLMAGIVIDESPVPNETVSFELPDSDGIAVSFGGRYKLNEKMEIGLSALYLNKESRDVSNDDIDGTFESSKTYLISTGFSYKF